MIRTDDPDYDFLVHDAMMQAKQDEYDRGCVKCAWCKKPIRQTDDPWCYELYEGEPVHPECLQSMFKAIRRRIEGKKLLTDLFDLMEDAYESDNQIRTPEPEIGDY